MIFSRQSADKWHHEVPGARWFRADLHVHTIDDRPGKKAQIPADIGASKFGSPEFLDSYARRVLRAAIDAKVHVLGLTPHAVMLENRPEASAVWAIVDCWNTAVDDDDVPFREKIYAVFPGFEPCLNEGQRGLHLLFLFDPEIGRDRYFSAFNLLMKGAAPWQGKQLTMSAVQAHEAFELIRGLDGFGSSWDALFLAPHVDSDHGLFDAQKGQALALFEHEAIAALEISDEKLPLEVINKKGAQFRKSLLENRSCFYHASDAYTLAPTGQPPAKGQLGYRVTWMKLAQPRIEALRQAFLAADSRVEIAYERDHESKTLVERTGAPEALPVTRPWLRHLKVTGGASFFSEADSERGADIPFNPGLTCVIGASMTGKSTLLDGLRLFSGAPLPAAASLRSTVEERGEGLLRGGATLDLDTPGRTSSPLPERWPAVFFTQNELQSLAHADGATEIIRGLRRGHRDEIGALDSDINEYDRALKVRAQRLEFLLDSRDAAAQKKEEAERASAELRHYEDAGLTALREASQLSGLVRAADEDAGAAKDLLSELRARAEAATLGGDIEAQLGALGLAPEPPGQLAASQSAVLDALAQLGQAIERWRHTLKTRRGEVEAEVATRRAKMEAKLAQAGLSAEQLASTKTLARKAALRDSYAQAASQAESAFEEAKKAFSDLLRKRKAAVDRRRSIFDDMIREVSTRFGDRIRIRRIEHARADELDGFLLGLRQKGITQWWRGLEVAPPSPEALAEAIDAGRLQGLGVSQTVAQRLRENIGESEGYKLRALRSEDRYVLEERLESGEPTTSPQQSAYRPLDQLSGGRRGSLLLRLLLEMEDDRPLVIDQPEDELDNRVLWDSILPALRRVKSKRQIIFVSHNANIVVNGDADLVVQLEADAKRGRVSISGAIEEAPVRAAIVETVDGGRDAFELRELKYGF